MDEKLIETEVGLIPEDWDVASIPKVAKNFDSKRRPLSSAQRENIKGQYPYYGAAGIIDYVKDYIFDGKYLLVAEDGTVTDNAGYPTLQLTDGKFWVSNHAHILQGDSYIETKFLYYALKNQNIRAFVTGAVQPKLNQENLNSILFPYPSLKDERGLICEILSSLDDKIELNRSINANLEKIASALFKHWFVDFEFPNAEGKPYKSSGGKMIDSELGEIPEGWSVGHFSDFAKVKSGFAFKGDDFNDNQGVPVIKIKNIVDPGVDLSDTQYVNASIVSGRVKEFILKAGDILIAMSGNTTGKIGVMPRSDASYLLNQRAGKYFLKDDNNKGYVYCYLRSGDVQRDIIQAAYGSAQPNISPSILEGLDIIIPDDFTLNKFNDIANISMETVSNNYFEINMLSQTRDSLLPRLMSGKIRVNI